MLNSRDQFPEMLNKNSHLPIFRFIMPTNDLISYDSDEEDYLEDLAIVLVICAACAYGCQHYDDKNVSVEDLIDVDSVLSERKRKSANKVKNVTCDKGGSSGTKKKRESFSAIVANSMSRLQQSLDFRASLLQQKAMGGGYDVDNQEKEMEQLREAMKMKKEANLTAAQNAKALLLFSSDKSSTWIEMFLNLPVSEWKENLQHIPFSSPKKG